MILTSYFANAKKFPKFRKTISISRFTPKWFKPDINALELAPSIQLLNNYKDGIVNDIEYKEIYLKETLSKLDPKAIAEKYKDGIFLCYESSSDFCHRQIVSEWLSENGFHTKELASEKIKIAVIGSGTFEDYLIFKTILQKLISNYSSVTIVSGGVNSTDFMAEKFAKEFNIEIEIINIDFIWNSATFGIAFWDGESKGTENSFKIAKEEKKQLYVYNYNEKSWLNI